MAKYFTSSELTRSATALRRGIDNTPPPEAAVRLETLASKLLDPVRELWGAPLTINSGYRCPALNAAVGGATASQHTRGEAADITTGTREGNRRLFALIVAAGNLSQDAAAAPNSANNLEFDQLIDERDYAWLHISYRSPREAGNRKQILHL